MIPHYHVALAGSVIHKGESNKDTDIMVFPHSTDHYNMQEICLRMCAADMHMRITNEVVANKWQKQGSTDTKYVEVWTWEGKRVDVFYPWNTRE